MSDQGFREVQLSGKQVVFLFMALAVALVGTFLLGVSVGRHVEPDTTTAQATPTSTPTTADVNPSGAMPPPTTLGPDDAKFTGTLRGKPEPPNSTQAATPKPTATATPAAPAPTTTPAPASKPATAAAATTGMFYVQVDSFSTKENAAREVSDLKAKGITNAAVVKSGTHFQVRIGPLERAAADTTHARLQKLGYKPRVTR